ncbi:hypothetical protein ACIQU6_30560 [Streptomyces sp. NPDC090442]|uniref:hypothetical protein n=1 Tax=Streptomyces sp. NPDC090442 TaxID=3365962 RepID=UPI00380413F0
MTEIAYTRNYVTQDQLRRAYRRLGHTSTAPTWSATLLIDTGLTMTWAVRVLAPAEVREEYPARFEWHVIADAGELDWPPLRPEEEIWPALLEKHPVPTGDQAQRQAKMFGRTVEELHREQLRQRYLSDAHIGRSKRNPTDVNFDPLVRDWDATARELAAFLDTHRPPKLTADQRVMAQGVHLAELEMAVNTTRASLGRLMRNAARESAQQRDGKPRHGFKSEMSRWGGVTRPTVDAWLNDGGCCEGAVVDEDGTPLPGHTHTIDLEED